MVLKVAAFKMTSLSQVSGGNIVQILYIQNLLAVSCIPNLVLRAIFQNCLSLISKRCAEKEVTESLKRNLPISLLVTKTAVVPENSKGRLPFSRKEHKNFQNNFQQR